MQPKTIKSKNNGCGTAPGNLVVYLIMTVLSFGIICMIALQRKSQSQIQNKSKFINL